MSLVGVPRAFVTHLETNILPILLADSVRILVAPTERNLLNV